MKELFRAVANTPCVLYMPRSLLRVKLRRSAIPTGEHSSQNKVEVSRSFIVSNFTRIALFLSGFIFFFVFTSFFGIADTI